MPAYARAIPDFPYAQAWPIVVLQSLPLASIVVCEVFMRPALRRSIATVATDSVTRIHIGQPGGFLVMLALWLLPFAWGWGYLWLERGKLFILTWLTGFIIMCINGFFVFLVGMTASLTVGSPQARLGAIMGYSAAFDRTYLLIVAGVLITSLHALWLPRGSHPEPLVARPRPRR